MSDELKVSFVLPDHYPVRNGYIGGFYFSDGISVQPSAVAPQAEVYLCGYYQCTRKEGVFKPRKKIVEKKKASKKAVTGAKLSQPNKFLE